ncbi:hypothetical protein C8Q74DRAFT_288561 [Fomes fomentarius]|nr:hypothetical protein C8Q74DRAFT_288561 [Fomes fomentarius]
MLQVATTIPILSLFLVVVLFTSFPFRFLLRALSLPPTLLLPLPILQLTYLLDRVRNLRLKILQFALLQSSFRILIRISDHAILPVVAFSATALTSTRSSRKPIQYRHLRAPHAHALFREPITRSSAGARRRRYVICGGLEDERNVARAWVGQDVCEGTVTAREDGSMDV